MTRILTGIQSTGTPHVGNLLGAIAPAVALAREGDNECMYFIADLHSLTSVKDRTVRVQNVREVAIAWMACGFCEQEDILYRQSKIPELLELAWYLSCHVPYPMLANAHAFKERASDLSQVNAGLFTYPVLMAADILLYQAQVVPVGKDQSQHVEITRDIASRINRLYGRDIFQLPRGRFHEKGGRIVGTDGRKMSKSYGNVLNVFSNEESLKKQVMSIHTDSTPLKDPKDPDACHVFNLYKFLAPPASVATMRKRYEAGGYGYGEAKQALLRLLLLQFERERAAYAYYEKHPFKVEEQLVQGEERAREIAKTTMKTFREVLGF